MRKLVIMLTALLAGSVLSAAVSITNITSQTQLETLNTEIATAAKKNFGFMTGSGNVTAATASEFPGLKFGLNVGVAGNMAMFSVYSSASQLQSITIDTMLASIPAPYIAGFFKIGIPGFIPFLEKSDVGVRFSYIPAWTFARTGAYEFFTGGVFGFGGELRKSLFELPAGLIRLEARLAYAMNAGNIGMQYTTTDVVTAQFKETINWSGHSISLRAVGGINIPVIFSAFAGIGPELNFGGVYAKSELTSTGQFNFSGTTFQATTGWTATSQTAGYDPFELRIIAGVRVFIIDIAAEYGLLSGGLSVNAGASLIF